MNEIFVLCPEVFLAVSSCVLLLLGFYVRSVSMLMLTFILVAAYLLWYQVPGGEVFAYNELFKSNDLIKTLKLMLLLSSAVFIVLYQGQKFAKSSMLKDYEFSVLLLLGITGMLLMLSANNFLSFYVSLELQSFCLYVLAAFERDDAKSSEAGLKYFILGSFASGLLLFGISLIYGFTGNLCFNQLAILLASHPSSEIAIGVTIGIVMVLIGLFFKTSAAPFHMWAPDVYQGSPTIVTCFFATVAKVAAIGFLYKISVETLYSWKLDLQPILLLVTCISVLVGAIGALKQTDIKRLLSYSSIGHVGYMLLAISAFKLDYSVVIYLGIYVSMTLGTFALIMNIKNDNKPIANIEDLSGLAKTHPLSAIALSIFMFSLAGIPPLAGFFAKFYVFQTAVDAGLYAGVIVSVVAAVIAAYYYLKIVKIMYLDEPKAEFNTDMAVSSKAIIILLALFNFGYMLLDLL